MSIVLDERKTEHMGLGAEQAIVIKHSWNMVTCQLTLHHGQLQMDTGQSTRPASVTVLSAWPRNSGTISSPYC